MKKLFTLFLLVISILCQGQINSYNDLFDLNLKGKPKSIKEISIFPLNDFTNPRNTVFLNSTVNEMLTINEYHFDSTGLISKEYHKNLFDTIGRWTDSKTRKMTHYKDSIIVVGLFPNGQEAWKEKRYLDKSKFSNCKIYDFPHVDTLKIERDKNNRIIKSYNHNIGPDSQTIVKLTNKYNSNGDILTQISYIKHFGLMYGNSPSIREIVTEFKYVYDNKNNWITRTAINDNKISDITQREILYD